MSKSHASYDEKSHNRITKAYERQSAVAPVACAYGTLRLQHAQPPLHEDTDRYNPPASHPPAKQAAVMALSAMKKACCRPSSARHSRAVQSAPAVSRKRLSGDHVSTDSAALCASRAGRQQRPTRSHTTWWRQCEVGDGASKLVE